MKMKGRNIKGFPIDGVAVDQEAILRLRGQLETKILEDMRVRGYVPALDITPELYWEYQQENKNFKYLVVVYGTYVGKKKSQNIMGMLGQHPIYTEPHEENHDT